MVSGLKSDQNGTECKKTFQGVRAHFVREFLVINNDDIRRS